MGGYSSLTNRSMRTAATIHRVLSEGLSRGVIGRSGALQDGRAININRVEVATNLQQVRVYWEPVADAARVIVLSAALERKRGFLSSYINSFLNQRIGARLSFVLEEEAALQLPKKLMPRKVREKVGRRLTAQQRLHDAFESVRSADAARSSTRQDDGK